MKKEIYLDNASTTPVYKEVAKVMNEVMLENYGNPSSVHALGEKARNSLIEAKKIIAKEINASPYEIIITSGATESNNLVLRGIALMHPERKKIIISSIEHASIYEEVMYLHSKGYEIAIVPVNKEGFVDMEALESMIDNETLLVSIMHANNEIGVIQDISAIGEICRANKIFFHTDAVQSFGKEKIDVKSMKIDMLSTSAHKIGGPKGVGFLYLNQDIDIKPILLGGGQEKGLRAGTENVAGAIGFAKALEIIKKIDQKKVRHMRDYFISKLKAIGGKINGSLYKRLANNVNVSFTGKDAEQIVLALSDKGIYCSTKSACLSKQKKENRVLASILLPKEEIEGALRFSISEKTKKEDVDFTVKQIKKLIS